MTFTEPGRSSQNHHAELEIRELKRRFCWKMVEKGVHKRMWDYGLKWTSEIMQRISRGPDGRTGYEQVTGNTPDISEWMDFDFYDLVWYFNKKHPDLTEDDRMLAYWLRVSHCYGSDLCYWILPISGIPITRTTVQHVTQEDFRNPELKHKIEQMKLALNKRLDDTNFQTTYEGVFFDDDEDTTNIDERNAYGDGTQTPSPVEYGAQMGNDIPAPEEDEIDAETYDKYIGAEVTLETTEGPMRATVRRRVTDADGIPVGQSHINPLFDTSI
jgi:hypothetical protein